MKKSTLISIIREELQNINENSSRMITLPNFISILKKMKSAFGNHKFQAWLPLLKSVSPNGNPFFTETNMDVNISEMIKVLEVYLRDTKKYKIGDTTVSLVRISTSVKDENLRQLQSNIVPFFKYLNDNTELIPTITYLFLNFRNTEIQRQGDAISNRGYYFRGNRR